MPLGEAEGQSAHLLAQLQAIEVSLLTGLRPGRRLDRLWFRASNGLPKTNDLDGDDCRSLKNGPHHVLVRVAYGKQVCGAVNARDTRNAADTV